MSRRMQARTLAQIERVLELRQQGFSHQQIADILGTISRWNVHNIVKADGRFIEEKPMIDTPENRALQLLAAQNAIKRTEGKKPIKKHRLTEEECGDIKKARLDGSAIREISRDMNLSYGVVWTFLSQTEIVTVNHQRKALVYVGKKKKKYIPARFHGKQVYLIIDENSRDLKIGMHRLIIELVGKHSRKEAYRVVPANEVVKPIEDDETSQEEQQTAPTTAKN